MRVFVLSLLAISSVNSHAIRYPHHSQLLAYSPARGEFPVYNDVAQGYLRYYDINGAQQQLVYTYPEPLYGTRRFIYPSGISGNQLIRTNIDPGFSAASYYQIQDTPDLIKAREEHFRRWCEQRYQALKAEMEKLRAAGLKPSSDMIAQMKPLEKIISSSTFTNIGDSPEIKRIRDEHLRIWNEARLKVLQQEADHLRFHHREESNNALKTSSSGISSYEKVIVGETADQKKAREEHLRIYNEQLQRIKQLEAQRLLQSGSKSEQFNQYQQGASLELKSSLQQEQQQLQFDQSGQVVDTPEVKRAREEHLRLVNEAKIRAQAESTYHKVETSESNKQFQFQQGPSFELRSGLQQGQQQVQQQQQQFEQSGQVMDTPEVIRAREEHLRLVNEAKLHVQSEGTYNKATASGATDQFNQFQQSGSFEQKSGLQQGQQQVQLQQSGQIMDTPEVIRAREEHLRLVNEVKLRAQAEGTYNKAETSESKNQLNQFQQSGSFELKSGLQQGQQQVQLQQSSQVMDTPEVIRAREEHLRLVNEAKLRAQAEGTYNKAEASGAKDQFNQFQQSGSFELKSGLQQGQQQVQLQQSGQVTDTPEVIRAREDHLRLVNEAKLRAQAEGTHNKAEASRTKDQFQPFQQGPSFELRSGLQQEQQQVQQQQLQFQQSGQIMDTPEVIRAREEHLRLVNEAKLRAQAEGTYNRNDDGSYKPEKIEASPVLKFVPSLQQPIQPIQNIAILQTTQPTQQAFVQQQESTFLKSGSSEFSQKQDQSSLVQDTQDAIRAREEHLRLVNEPKLKASEKTATLNNIQQTEKVEAYAAIADADKLRETERLREEQRLMEVERMREAERMREEERMREMERLREMEQKKLEERKLEAERLRLKKEEEERLEKERLASTLKPADQATFQLKSGAQSFESSSSGSASSSSSATSSGSVTGTGFVLSSQYQNNPYLVRFASQPGTTAYIVGEQQAAIGAKPSLLYLPTKADSTGAFKQQNPFLLRFSQSGIQAQGAQQQTALEPIGSSGKISTYSSSSGSLSSGSSSSASFNYDTSANIASLTELEKATRDHFRAHEIALEQLRLAKLKNPQGKDC